MHESFTPNISIIPGGDHPRDPTELLYSKLLSQLLDWGLENNCHVILDCPPVWLFADAAVLASKVDGVLLVVSAGENNKGSLPLSRSARDRFRRETPGHCDAEGTRHQVSE